MPNIPIEKKDSKNEFLLPNKFELLKSFSKLTRAPVSQISMFTKVNVFLSGPSYLTIEKWAWISMFMLIRLVLTSMMG